MSQHNNDIDPHNDSVEQNNVVRNNTRVNSVVNSHYDLRGSKRASKPVLRLSPSMDGKTYGDITLTQLIHPDTKLNGNNSGIISVCMTQYSLKKGIDKFGLRADKEIIDELKQLHERGTFTPIKKEDIPTGDLKNVLESHMF